MSEGFCSWECSIAYDNRAQERGGYHVLARDEEIARLKEEIADLRWKARFRAC